MNPDLDDQTSYLNITKSEKDFPTGNIDIDTSALVNGLERARELGTSLKIPTNNLSANYPNPIKFNQPLQLNGCGLVGLDSVATNGDSQRAPVLQYVGKTEDLGDQRAWISMTNNSWISGITLLGEKREEIKEKKHVGILFNRVDSDTDSGTLVRNVSIRDLYDGIVSAGENTEPGRVTIENCYIFSFASRGVSLGARGSAVKDFSFIHNVHCRNPTLESGSVGFELGHVDGIMVTNCSVFYCDIGLECVERVGGRDKNLNGPSPSITNFKADACKIGMRIVGRTNAKISTSEIQALYQGIKIGDFGVNESDEIDESRIGDQSPSNVLITNSKVKGNTLAINAIKGSHISITNSHIIALNEPQRAISALKIYGIESAIFSGNIVTVSPVTSHAVEIYGPGGKVGPPSTKNFEDERIQSEGRNIVFSGNLLSKRLET